MSFNIVKAGNLDEVKTEVAGADVYGNLAGEATKRFVAEILDLSGSEKMIVEASGHSGREPGGHVSVQINIRPAL